MASETKSGFIVGGDIDLNGNELINIGAVDALSLTDKLDGLQSDIDAVDGDLADLLAGSAAFSAPVSGVAPTAGSHLTTKDYVDGLISGLDWQESILDKDLSAPTGSEVTGDRLWTGSSPSGPWAGQANKITVKTAGGWDFITVDKGTAFLVEDENLQYQWNGSALAAFGALVSHTALLNIGTNTHAQIDTHLANTSNPHSTSIANIGGGTLAQLNAAVSDADVPALAGQLGGTAASPDVRGVREGGGQLLTFGSILDGEAPRRVGTDIVGRDSRRVRKTGNQTVASTTPADCTDLSFTGLKASTTYIYRFVLYYDAAATTTGLRITVDYTGTVTETKYGLNAPRTATAATWAAATADDASLTASDSVVGTMQAVIEGCITTNGTGDLNLQIAGDAAANITVQSGSFGVLEQV